MFKKYLKNQKGLTLIELLAVIVILGIIAAIAVPAIGNVINNSKEEAALADAQQIIDAAKLYVASESENISSGLSIASDNADFAEYIDKAGTFTSVNVSATGDYSIVGHDKANAAASERGSTLGGDSKNVLTEAELQKAINNED